MTTDLDPVLIDVPMPVVTPRLILRPKQPGDGVETAAAVAETWQDLHEWMLWAERQEDHTSEKQEIRTRKVMAQFILREDLTLTGVERATGRPVVWTGLHGINWRTRSMMVGYWVRKSAQGHGYAGEATNALLRYAFNALQATRVTINHAEGNEASRRTIEKLGFVKEGVTRKASLLPGGRILDSHHYARLDLEGLPPLDVRWGPP